MSTDQSCIITSRSQVQIKVLHTVHTVLWYCITKLGKEKYDTWIWINIIRWLLSLGCIVFPTTAQSYQISFFVYEFLCSFRFWVSKLSSALPWIPFWNMDDKGRWPLWLLRNAKWNLLVNWSSGCKYFSACHRAEGWLPNSRKGWRWSLLQLILFLFSESYGGIHIFRNRDINSLTVNYKHLLSLKYLLWACDFGYWLSPVKNNCLLEETWQ